MNLEQSKFILQSMRPDGQDAGNSQGRNALEAARSVPELARWLEAEQHFDRQFSRALLSVSPPAHLQSRILAGAMASRRQRWWQKRFVVAIAAAFAVIAAISIYEVAVAPSGEPAPLAEFRSSMLNTLETMSGLGFSGPSQSDVRSWLASHQGVADASIPSSLADNKTLGCNVLDWEGRKVTLICFRPDEVATEETAPAHLMVVDQAELSDWVDAPSGSPQFANVGGWATAAWQEGQHVYFMATLNSPEQLARILKSGSAAAKTS